MFADPLTERLVAFVRGIGIAVRATSLPEQTFLPGIDIRDGAILIDEARLTYPGDILHEAGHLAVADPAERNAPAPSGSYLMNGIGVSSLRNGVPVRPSRRTAGVNASRTPSPQLLASPAWWISSSTTRVRRPSVRTRCKVGCAAT